jgi:hypothetical protein
MRGKFLALAGCLLLAAPFIQGQANASCPATKTLDDLVKALDDAVGGPVDKDRTCLRQLLLPDARLIPVSKGKDGSITPHILTVDDWIARVKATRHAPFVEVQVRYPADVYGHIAHLWSTYEVRPTADGKPDVRGINSIQAIFDGQNWKIMQVMWQAETPDEPVPAKYLP